MPFLKGIGGTGKGVIIETLRQIYEEEDVAILGDNIEKSFGLEPMMDKLIFVAPEIEKLAENLNQAVFQSIITGEQITTNKKHVQGTGVGKKWTSPGFMAGNKLPAYQDNGGSISRRILLFIFEKYVKDGDKDNKLLEKIAMEIPLIIKKANCAYLDIVNRLKGKDIKTILPQYFRNTQRNISSQTNSFYDFLESEMLRFNPEYYCLLKDFRSAYKGHCDEYELGKPKRWNEDLYLEPFQKLTISNGFLIELDEGTTRREYGGVLKRGKYIIGLKLVDEDDEENEDDEL